MKKFPNFRIISKKRFQKGNEEANRAYLSDLESVLKEKIALSKWLFKKEKWDVFITNFMEIDHVQHFFWSYMDDQNSSFHQAIFHMYELVDDYLISLIKNYRVSHNIMVASDHGAGIARETIYPNIWLEKKGYLVYKKDMITRLKHRFKSTLLRPDVLRKIAGILSITQKIQQTNNDNENTLVRKVFLDIKDVDFEKTQAFSFGEYGGIFLTVPDNKKEKLIKKIVKQFKKDLGSRVTFIESTTKLYGKSGAKLFPDILFLIDDGATTATSVYAFAGHHLFDEGLSGKSSNHRMNGIYSFLTQDNVGTMNACDIYDIVPTIYSLFNIPKSSKLKGKNLYSRSKYTEVSEIII